MGGKTRIASLVCMALLVAGTAFAAIPDPTTSIVPNVVYSPNGSLDYTVVVNNGAGAPVAGSTVRVVFSAEADALVCWCAGQTHPVIQATTNAAGEAVFNIAAGGCIDPNLVAAPPAVQVFADGVLLDEVGAVGADAVDDNSVLPTSGWKPGRHLPGRSFRRCVFHDSSFHLCLRLLLGHQLGRSGFSDRRRAPDRPDLRWGVLQSVAAGSGNTSRFLPFYTNLEEPWK